MQNSTAAFQSILSSALRNNKGENHFLFVKVGSRWSIDLAFQCDLRYIKYIKCGIKHGNVWCKNHKRK